MSAYMEAACEEARKGMERGDGGPFGAVVVKDGRIVSAGHNMVLTTNDSTAHAEIVAIRRAEQVLGTFDLNGCELYTTCYPCPMCMGATLWARITRIHYGCTQQEAAAIGFDDARFWAAIHHPKSTEMLEMHHCESDACRTLFQEWAQKSDRHMY